jgi:hypothetical protein
MRWPSLLTQRIRSENWELWFAWHPVWDELSREWFWLEYVWRNRFGMAGWSYVSREDYDESGLARRRAAGGTE